MAISPAINPQVIVGNRPKNIQSFQNFISGGSPLGSSVVSNAANNIVGFQRAAVKPAVPDINSIVNTISSNILNQVDNSIRSATNIINQTTETKLQKSRNDILGQLQEIRVEKQNNQVTQLQTTVERIQNQTTNIVQQISEDYKKRVGDIDSSRPNNLLSNFIDLYKTAIDFIKFFGDRRNIDGLRNNLTALRESFTESFEVAKLIRNTIIKIVNQLSSLPKVGPGSSSGLNVDVNVPGGGTRKALPRGVSPGKMKGRLGMIGLGLGGVAAGGMAVNALAGSRDDVQAAPSEKSLPGQVLDTFSILISRFANAVDEMVNGAENSQSGPKGSPSSSTSSKTGGGPSPSPGGPKPGKSTTAAGEFEDIHRQAAKIVQERESAGAGLYNAMNQGTVPDAKGQQPRSGPSQGIIGKNLTDMTIGEVIAQQNKSLTNDKGFIHAAGAYQFIGNTLPGAMSAAGLKPSDKFSPENQDLMFYAVLKDRGLSPWQADPRHKKYTQAEAAIIEKARKTPLKPRGSATSASQITPPPGQTLGVGGENTPDWVLSPQKREELKLSTEMVSQPPPSQTEAPKITTLPLDLSGAGNGGGQQSAAGPIPAPTRNAAVGPQIPYIPSSDPENFLVLYSKIVYNIVDG